MTIKQITIEGTDGDVIIERTKNGATVTARGLAIDVNRSDDGEHRYELARRIACSVYGISKPGRPKATNSMVHDLLREIERVAGC